MAGMPFYIILFESFLTHIAAHFGVHGMKNKKIFSARDRKSQGCPDSGRRRQFVGVFAFVLFAWLPLKSVAYQGGLPRSVLSKYTAFGEPRLLGELSSHAGRSSLISFRPSNWSALTSEASHSTEMPTPMEHASAPMSFMLSVEGLLGDEADEGKHLLPRLGVRSFAVGPKGRFYFRGNLGRFLIGISPKLTNQDKSEPACHILEGSVQVGFEESGIGGIVGYVRESGSEVALGKWSWCDSENVWTDFDGAGTTTSWGGVELMNRFSSGHQVLDEASICIRDLYLDESASQLGLRREVLDSSTNKVLGYTVVFLYLDCA